MKFSVDGRAGIVCSPSYKRPWGVHVTKWLPGIRLYVDGSEAAAYREANPLAEVVELPPGIQGNVSRVRNYILDQHKGQVTCMMDDDVRKLEYHEGSMTHDVDAAQFIPFLVKYTRMAMDLNASLWGVNLNADKQCYKEYLPFTLTNIVLGPFTVHLDPICRYDEAVAMVEDYDFAIQTLNRHRIILRLQKYHYVCQQGGSTTMRNQTGGCAAMRTKDRQLALIKVLQKKWGEDIVRLDGLDTSRNHKSSKERTFDINPVIRVPIGGV